MSIVIKLFRHRSINVIQVSNDLAGDYPGAYVSDFHDDPKSRRRIEVFR